MNNPLTPDPKECRAQVVSNGPKTLNDAIERALERGTLVTRTDLIAASEILFDVLSEFVVDGHTVITPLIRIRPSIRGSFENNQASFDRNRQEVFAAPSAGPLLRKKLARAKPRKIKPSVNEPILMKLIDQKSGGVNSEITPGGMALLIGQLLRFDAADPRQGLFFADSNRAETRVTDILEASAKKISFSIPASLAPGRYSLVLRTLRIAKKMRSGDMGELEVIAF